MRLHVLSDLHTERGPQPIRPVDADVLILAGDIANGTAGLDLVAEIRDAYRAVIFVAGNHEYDGRALPRLDEDLRHRGEELGIHVLENDSVTIDGVAFLGCALWTDFAIGEPEISQAAAIAEAEAVMDFGSIRVSPTDRPLTTADVVELHATSRDWLDRTLVERAPGPCVVVTHFPPSPGSIAPKYVGSPLNGAFVSNLHELIERHDIDLWIHGHTHHCVDYDVSGTRIFSNQLGYPGEDAIGFDFGCVIEVPSRRLAHVP